MPADAEFGSEILGWRLRFTDDWIDSHRLLEVGLFVGGKHYGAAQDPVFHGEVRAILSGIAQGRALRRPILDVATPDPQALFDFVHQRVYGPMELAHDEVTRWYKRLEPHLLAPNGLECFDDCEIMAVPVQGGVAIIAGAQRPSRERVQAVESAVVVADGLLETLTLRAVEWIDRMLGLRPQ